MARVPDNLVSSITHSLISNLKTTSVVNPLLISLGIITLPCLIMLPHVDKACAVALICFAALPAICFFGFYGFFALTNPDYLRSENY